MTNTPYDKSVMAGVALEYFPPLIRNSLLSEKDFREEYGIKAEVTIALGPSGVAVQRSELFNAVRNVLSGEAAEELTDAEGRTWNLEDDAREGGTMTLVLSSDQQRLLLPDFSALSNEASRRISSLEAASEDVNLPQSAQLRWRKVLEERALEDDEVDAFHSDMRDTPVHVGRAIKNEISAGKSSVSALVPNSRRYFERLVGAYDGSCSIREYAVGAGREILKQLECWQAYEGFLFSLLLSSHSALTGEINADHLDAEELERAFDYLLKNGDVLSQLGALEVGLRILSYRPEVEPFLLPLVHRIRDDDVESRTSEFKLLSALFVLVDGELARTRLFFEEPPFFRRLASMAQAALIHRQFVGCGVDYEQFSNWAVSNRGEHYYMQSLCDMRAEPRWCPDLIAAPQIKAEFFGRIMIAGNSFVANVQEGELHDIMIGDGEQSLIKLSEFPGPHLPGPLEGSEECPNALPDSLANIIEKDLNADEIQASSFIALINSAMVFRIESIQAELAAKSIRLHNHTLANLDEEYDLFSILNGLATVAAVSRNPVLADEVRVLVRRYRGDARYGFNIEEAMRTCLVASAAREDITEWREFAGAWLTELAFGDLEGDEAEVFHSHLLALLHSAPELWVSCARADAALKAWRFR